jgi:hypothetical protein
LYYIKILKKWRREIYFPLLPSPQAFICPKEVSGAKKDALKPVDRGSESGGKWGGNGGNWGGNRWNLRRQVVEIESAVVEIGSSNAKKESLMLLKGLHNGVNMYRKFYKMLTVGNSQTTMLFLPTRNNGIMEWIIQAQKNLNLSGCPVDIYYL